MAKIYVASSWRNPHQPWVVKSLRGAGHAVYDFRNPPCSAGFAWSELDPNWESWSAAEYRDALKHPRAVEGFKSDFDHMKWADTCVLVLPCGRSAHLEAGWMAGAGKQVIILTQDGEEPELMALLADHVCISIKEVLDAIDPKAAWAETQHGLYSPGILPQEALDYMLDALTPRQLAFAAKVSDALDGEAGYDEMTGLVCNLAIAIRLTASDEAIARIFTKFWSEQLLDLVVNRHVAAKGKG